MSDTTTVTEIARNTIRLETLSLKSLEESIGFDFEQILQLIHESKGKVVITGVGKSGIIAMKIAASLSSTGTPAIYLHAADATHGDLGMVEKKDIVIGISKSGNSQEIKDLIPFLKNNGNTLIGMTANRESYLGKQSDHLLYTPVEKDLKVESELGVQFDSMADKEVIYEISEKRLGATVVEEIEPLSSTTVAPSLFSEIS